MDQTAGERKGALRGGLSQRSFSGNNSSVIANLLSEQYMTVEEYLTFEEESQVKHEYLGGVVYAMSGASNAHNTIEVNLNGMLYNRLRGRPCRPFGSNMKVRLQPQLSGRIYFYYPDAMIACDPTDSAGHGWRERPATLFEIMSPSTRHIDTREKRLAYLQLPSLEAYVRFEQKRPEAIVERRTLEGWKLEKIVGLDGVIHLPTLDIELPLAELYEGETFPTVESSPGRG